MKCLSLYDLSINYIYDLEVRGYVMLFFSCLLYIEH
jgi:hypothetical protein